MTIHGDLNTGAFRLDELGVSTSEMVAASASQATDDMPLASAYRIRELEAARTGTSLGADIERVQAGEDPADVLYGERPSVKKIPVADARLKVKEAGLDKALTLPDEDITEGALSIMMARAKERHTRNMTIARGPDGFVPSALSVGTSFLLQAVDPINVASAFIPVVGEVRYARALAGAGESLARRAAVRAQLGAVEGVAGAAVVEPLIMRARWHEGADYTMGDFLTAMAFGAGLGSGLHVGFGGARDLYRARRGEAQYPFGSGEPLRGEEVGRITQAMEADGVVPPRLDLPTLADAPDTIPRDHPAPEIDSLAPERLEPSPVMAAIDDLPGQAKQDALMGAIAAVTRGEAVRAGEMIEAAAATDPRIAESLELYAWHGSPHDFDRFDIRQIGTGEGAQSYGHGLYFAENEKVAHNYQRSTFRQDFVRKAQDLYDEYSTPDEAAVAMRESPDLTPQQKRLLIALEADDWWGFDYPHQAVREALKRDALERYEASNEVKEALEDIGHIYKVKIEADPQRLLDWDKPLSEQSQFVQDALLNHPDPIVAGTAAKWGFDIGNMYKRIAQRLDGPPVHQPAKASALLKDAGIQGFRYLDQASRDAGDGTRNIVVFDDSLVEITEKNGQPLQGAAKAEAIESMQPQKPTAIAATPAPAAEPAGGPRDRATFEALASRADDPESLAASQAADQVEPPKTLQPSARTAAAERFAAEADAIWKANEAYIPDDLKERIDAEVKALDLHAADRATALEQGAACLAAAAA